MPLYPCSGNYEQKRDHSDSSFTKPRTFIFLYIRVKIVKMTFLQIFFFWALEDVSKDRTKQNLLSYDFNKPIGL